MVTNPKIEVDLSRLKLPSDNVTIKMMRLQHPNEGVKLLERDDEESASAWITSMFLAEEILARAAFDRFRRTLSNHPEEIAYRQAITDELAEYYAKYGLASGKHHAEQLIRDIESQAESQARQHTGQVR